MLPDAVFLVCEKRITFVNQVGLTLLKAADEADVLGRSLQEFLYPSVSEENPIDDSSVLEYQLHREDGTRIDVECNAAAFHEDGKPFVQALVRDISRHRNTRNGLRSALDKSEATVRESSHRIKNHLQLLISMLKLQAGATENCEVKAALEEIRSRMMAVATAHERLSAGRHSERVDLADYLGRLLGNLRDSLGHDRSDAAFHRFETALQPVSVTGDQAISCGLILTELVMNALKHAFLPGKSGTISVRCDARNGLAWLRVADNGRGLPGNRSDTEWDTLGLKLVLLQAKQVRGNIQVQTGPGACFELCFPLTSAGSGKASEADRSRM